MKHLFDITVQVAPPILIGQDQIVGRRQLIPILSGTLSGKNIEGHPLVGTVLPGGVDSQVIRPDGICQLSARYGVQLEDGTSFYIENNGIRTVPDAYVAQVLQGAFIPPELYYFATTPSFEVYDPRLHWLKSHLFVCKATRLETAVLLSFHVVD